MDPRKPPPPLPCSPEPWILSLPGPGARKHRKAQEDKSAEEAVAEPEAVAEQKLNSEKEEETYKTRDVIFIGSKPIMTYVTATLTQLASLPMVTLTARGKRITQAIDVSQMIVKRMDEVGFVINDVRTSSDSLTSEDGRVRNVSNIEIDIKKVLDN